MRHKKALGSGTEGDRGGRLWPGGGLALLFDRSRCDHFLTVFFYHLTFHDETLGGALAEEFTVLHVIGEQVVDDLAVIFGHLQDIGALAGFAEFAFGAHTRAFEGDFFFVVIGLKAEGKGEQSDEG